MSCRNKGSGPPLLLSYRALVAGLCFFAFANLYMQRINLPVAIVCMVNHTALSIAAGTEASAVKFSDCGAAAAANASQDMEDGEFFWSKDTQGLVLSAYSWGYLTTQVLGGLLSLRFGGKAVLTFAMLLGSLATFVSPPLARLHPWAMIVLRVLNGMCGGLVYAAVFTVLSKWVPPGERSLLVGNATAGTSFGALVALILGGFLCRYGFSDGWPSIFYIYGGAGLVWCVLWTILVTDNPASNSWVSKAEVFYIEATLQGTITRKDTRLAVPWLKILTSVPVWAVIVAHTSTNVALYIFYTLMPTYLREVIGFPITQNGILSALPYVGRIFVTFTVTSTASWLLSSRILGRTGVRKVFNSFGQMPLAAFILVMTFLSCSHRGLSVALLTIGLSCTGALDASGYLLNPADIAPLFVGVLFSISNTFATIPGVIAPSIVSAMTPERTRLEWNNVFYMASAVCFSGSMFYLIFARTELQDWARPSSEEEEEEEKERKKELNEDDVPV